MTLSTTDGWRFIRLRMMSFHVILLLPFCCYYSCSSQFILSHSFFFAFHWHRHRRWYYIFFHKRGELSPFKRQEGRKAFSNCSNSDGINIYHDIKWTKDLQMWMCPSRKKRNVIILQHISSQTTHTQSDSHALILKHVVNNLSEFSNRFYILRDQFSHISHPAKKRRKMRPKMWEKKPFLSI